MSKYTRQQIKDGDGVSRLLVSTRGELDLFKTNAPMGTLAYVEDTDEIWVRSTTRWQCVSQHTTNNIFDEKNDRRAGILAARAS